MWVDDDEQVHTVAIPDPRPHFPEDLVRRIQSSSRAEQKRLYEFLEALEDEVIDEIDDLRVDQEEEARFAELEIPDELVLSVADLDDDWMTRTIEALALVPIRWRLDFVLALGDLVDVE